MRSQWEVMGGVLERSVGGQRGVMGGHRDVVEGQWEAIAIKCNSNEHL